MVETFSLGFDGGTEVRFRVLRSWVDKMRGLLGPRCGASPVVLVGCASIHTFGMEYPIDVALVDHEGRVRKARRGLPPCRVIGTFGGWLAFERPASNEPWMNEGGRLVSCEEMAGLQGVVERW